MGLIHHPLPDTPASPDALVLGRRRLRSGVRRSDTSRLRDDVWRLSPALHQRQQSALILNFLAIPVRFRPTVKLLFYALLNTKPPAGQQRLEMVTIHGYFQAFKEFLDWLDSRPYGRFNSLTPDDLRQFQRHLQATVSSAGQRANHRRSVRLLWTWREHLADDHLALDPERLEDDWHEGKSRVRKRENANPRIPEQVVSPLVIWSLRFVDDFADDILAAQDEWLALQKKTRRDSQTGQGARRRLAALMRRYREERRPLPGGTGGQHGINIRHLAREVDCDRQTLMAPASWELIEQARRDVGVDDSTYLRTEIRGLLDGESWLRRISYDEDLAVLVRILTAASYTLVAYLSGMRDSEVKHLRRGCLTIAADRTGKITRSKITSMAFKGEGTPLGVEATWVVGRPVARAVEVLERLQPKRQRWLFAIPPSSHTHNKPRSTGAKTTKATNNDLNLLVTWINDYCRRHGRTDHVPDVSKRPWRLSTAQFRRTLAWFIGRRPGGSIAGAIQYRHLSVQMFEGYAGTSKAGFRAEAQQEALLARGEGLSLMVDRHEHERLRGPSADEARVRLDRFGDRVRFLGKTPDDGQMRKLMERNDPQIYPGRFVTCTDNANRRLCRLPGEADTTPDPGQCKPLACRNVALTDSNIQAWLQRLAEQDARLRAADALAPRVRVRLEEDSAEIRGFLARVGALEPGEASA
ncbi:hypothetical protein ADK57_04460 [Streptomyces sp. MMG1533]|uniref:phage integrase N-terminal SAM-like domain-containing protein n=1 Tax=Streptomyces sp. MMG1533 TaxID=1415546 RepID=UPI0006AE712B|nr:phage integrase N-terminal SAM-like domain-containing protein [Streptomyces sp. MMG1533]KOU76770.1 hypothetical protein ADK57_04460 [Streptomyces sp. MMG1533]